MFTRKGFRLVRQLAQVGNICLHSQFSKSHLLEPDFSEWACDFTRLYGLLWVTFGKLPSFTAHHSRVLAHPAE